MLIDLHGQLRVVGASSERARMLELLELQNDDGPGMDCYRSGMQITVPYLTAPPARWPAFGDAARSAGFASLHAMPMRLRTETIGALNLLHGSPGLLDPVRRKENLAEQLQIALHSRVVIEQAKGVVSERLGVSMDEAFATMRRFARHYNHRIAAVAARVLEGSVDLGDLPGQ
jgi:hypothetical protein